MASQGGGDILSSFRRLGAHVGIADMLRVTLRHLHDLRPYLDELSSSLLPPAPTFVANRERNLVVSPPLVRRAAENLARQEQKGGIVIERRFRLSTKLRHRFTERGVRFRRNFKSKDMPSQ
jgi:hypothetical protein